MELKCSYRGSTSVRLDWGRQPLSAARRNALGDAGHTIEWDLASDGVLKYTLRLDRTDGLEEEGRCFELESTVKTINVNKLEPSTSYTCRLTYVDSLGITKVGAPRSHPFSVCRAFAGFGTNWEALPLTKYFLRL